MQQKSKLLQSVVICFSVWLVSTFIRFNWSFYNLVRQHVVVLWTNLKRLKEKNNDLINYMNKLY